VIEQTSACVYCPGSSLRDEQFVAYQDDDIVVFPAPRQAATNHGFSMLVTKRHIRDLHALPDHMVGPVIRGLQLAGTAVRSAFNADGLTFRQNTGPPGQHTPHLHFHLVPRHRTDGHDGFIRGPLQPVEPEVRERQARLIADRLGSQLRQQAMTQFVDPPDDVVAYQDDHIVIAPARTQRLGNHGEMVVMLRQGAGCLATMPELSGTALLYAVRRTSVAVQRAFGATGTTIRLHDGPPDQELPRVGFYVIPRHLDDRFLDEARRSVPAAKRREQAIRVAAALDEAGQNVAYAAANGFALGTGYCRAGRAPAGANVLRRDMYVPAAVHRTGAKNG
jgi:diadenosine tetraphosphate (Ap4A) HIT family hydrolase